MFVMMMIHDSLSKTTIFKNALFPASSRFASMFGVNDDAKLQHPLPISILIFCCTRWWKSFKTKNV